MDTVHNISEAIDWMEKHPGERVLCVNGDQHEVCDNYPDADVFFMRKDSDGK